MRRPLVIGNWKMFTSLSDALVLSTGVRDGVEEFSGIEVVLCPPVIWLTEVAEVIHKGAQNIALGAQNINYLSEGEYTGEISANMVRDVAKYVIVGHSERRKYFVETNNLVSRKVAAAIDAGLSPIVCVGEKERGDNSVHEVVKELEESLVGVKKEEYKEIIVTYEPVWAVGADQPADPDYCSRIIVKLRELVDSATPIVYGGDVNASNVYNFIKRPEIDGVLVGRASLKATDFIKICRIVSEYKRII